MLHRILEFLKSPPGIILMSIIWGIGLASLFYTTCSGPDCMVIHGPDPKTIDNKIYRNDGVCYRYDHYVVPCK